MPLLLHWPRRLAPADVDTPVSNLDILPTVAELVGVAPHPAWQGRSFADPMAYQAQHGGLFIHLQGLRAVDGVVCWPYKLTLDYTAGTVVLVDLATDPGEETNLYTPEHPLAAALADMVMGQMAAQDRYHARRDATRAERFAPRLGACPEPRQTSRSAP